MPAPCKPPPGSSQPIAGALPSRPGNASGRHPASVRVLLKTGLASVALMLFNFYLKVPRPSLLLPDSSALPTTHAVPAGWKRGVSIKCISGRLKGSVRFFSGNSGSIVARGLDCQSNMLYLKHFCLIIGSPHLHHQTFQTAPSVSKGRFFLSFLAKGVKRQHSSPSRWWIPWWIEKKREVDPPCQPIS